TATLYQGSLKSFCVPVLNCYACPNALFSCPIGTIQHFMVTGHFPFYALGTLGVVGSAVGRMTCGTLCPFGFFQDILYKFRTWKFSLPQWVRWFRYVVLVSLVFIIPYITHENWFSKLCPMGTLIAGLPWVTLNVNVRSMVKTMFWVKISILLFFVTTSTMTKRPFCRAVCPLGAIFSVFNKASFLKLEWNADTCTRCGKCQKICPVDIRVDREPNSIDCLRCLDCTRCPSVKLTTIFTKEPFKKAESYPGVGREEREEVAVR
ncbi:MAG: 4Fe-4S binding protein, partial [Deltaproteobacteria bacterium]